MLDRIVLVGAGRTSRSIVDRLARLAPLTIVDTAQAALDAVSTDELGATGATGATGAPGAPGATDTSSHPILKRIGDGTSRIVLSDLRGDPRSGVGLVIAPGDDRSALESCRLAAELEYRPVVAVVNNRAVADGCEKHGARALVRADIVGQLVEQSLLQAGLGVSGAVGFGRGDMIEFRVRPSSPAIGVPLSKLPAEGWRVAAIYRGPLLVLPKGSTKIEADDRVLLIGDPKQLPHVAESLRMGIPTFPLLHGPNVVVYMPRGREGAVETEAEVLTTRTRAARMIRMYPHASAARKVVDTPLADGTTSRKRFEDAELTGEELVGHIAALRAKQPGVVVTKAPSRDVIDLLLGRGGREAILCNDVGVPVLFPRGSAHHERVMLCVTDGEIDLGVGEVALDLARMFSVPLRILRVKLPTYLQEAEAATERLVETIAQRARFNGLDPEVEVLEGNPIAEWVRASTPSDLSVISRRPSTRDSFSKPDLALQVARKSRGSVLVITVKS